MRFEADGPDVPDELLVARDRGEVLFFCGAGVSQGFARLPSFEQLGGTVLADLGAASESPARLLLREAGRIGRMAAVGSLVATDRVFGLLEREFEVADVRQAVAKAVKPAPDVDLTAHRILADLATTPSGETRLVTTNFDLLFEAVQPQASSFGPPHLPDPNDVGGFGGIVHLHGRVNRDYNAAADAEFVVSSADFGRAYLADGWATRFIRALLERFQIVFVGYSGDDPPMQYLLEALNLRAGSRSRLFAFQEGEADEAAGLWEHKGVRAITFPAGDYGALWRTLGLWAERARDPGGWATRLLQRAASGPEGFPPHERRQVGHLASTMEGARKIARTEPPLNPTWLLSFDADARFTTPTQRYGAMDDGAPYDPFPALSLDSDPPQKALRTDNTFDARERPTDAWDAFNVTRRDQEAARGIALGTLKGRDVEANRALAPRLQQLGQWLLRVADHPVALWWAAGQSGLHPEVRDSLEAALRHEATRFTPAQSRGWRALLAAWSDNRKEPDLAAYAIGAHANQQGWTDSLVRELADVYRPRLTAKRYFHAAHPLTWNESAAPEAVIEIDIEYPRPHEPPHLPASHLAYAVSLMRGHLELATSLEREHGDRDELYFQTTRADDGEGDLIEESYGLTGLILAQQQLVARLAEHDPQAALDEVRRWPAKDDFVFARLRMWAAAHEFVPPDEAAELFLKLSDRAFNSSTHERDLLYALRDRWRALPSEAQKALEQRLLTTSFDWSENVRGGRDHAIAHERLSRLHWLSSNGVAFSFDLEGEMRQLKSRAPDWTPAAGEHAADSNLPRVYDIVTDDSPEALLHLPLGEVLTDHAVGEADFLVRIQREPFRGLARERPQRALAALSLAARRNASEPRAWRTFLGLAAREKDSTRLLATTVHRLLRLPGEAFQAVLYPTADWCSRLSSRLQAERPDLYSRLWTRLVEGFGADQTLAAPQGERTWADIAVSSVARPLDDMLGQDPTIQKLKDNESLPQLWRERAEQLLRWPATQRRLALVLIARRLVWLHRVDPVWTETWIMPFADQTGEDAEAFWYGVYWGGRIPPATTFAHLKRGMLARAARTDGRRVANVLSAFLTSAWLAAHGKGPADLMTNVELREVIIAGPVDLQLQFIRQAEQLLEADNGRLRHLIPVFFREVWPKQSALRTPALSARLVDFLFASGDLLPELSEIVLPRLVPLRGAYLRLTLEPVGDDHPARAHPAATLSVVWAALSDDRRDWPYRVEDIIQMLLNAPETANDPRLTELMRRLER